MRLRGYVSTVVILVLVIGVRATQVDQSTSAIPRTWDDAEIARHEVPLG